MRRAHALFTLKGFQKSTDGEYAVIHGIATTPTPDRYGDIVEPLGAKFALPLPLLWQHRGSEPVGQVSEAAVQADGITVVARMPLIAESKTLRERIEEAVESVTLGLVRGLSIGFRGMPEGVDINMDTYTFHFREWEWLELSLVTIPANAEATIQVVRAFDVHRAEVAGATAVATPAAEDVERMVTEYRRRASLQRKGAVFANASPVVIKSHKEIF